MFRKLLPRRWNFRPTKSDLSPEITIEERQNHLGSIYLLFAILIFLLHLFVNIYDEDFVNEIVDWSFIITLVVLLILNEKGFNQFAKISGLLFINFLVFFYSNYVPADSGFYLFFFPLLGATLTLFNKKEYWIRNVFFVLTISLFAILRIYDFQVFQALPLQTKDHKAIFVINIILSGSIFSFTISYVLQLHKKPEEQLAKKREKFQNVAKELAVKNKELEKTNTELDHFVYSTSHDLKAPLMSILGLVNIAQTENKQEDMPAYLDMIKNRILKLDQFINDVLDFSKNERTEIEYELVDFEKIIDSTLNDLSYLEESGNVSIQKKVRLEKPVYSDSRRISIIFHNLIANAIKYRNPYNGQSTVDITVRDKDNKIDITISDNGLGIASEEQEKVFGMFYRAHEKSTGSGLGLYIVKQVLEKLQGTIQLDSQPGRGTSIFIKFPCVAHREPEII